MRNEFHFNPVTVNERKLHAPGKVGRLIGGWDSCHSFPTAAQTASSPTTASPIKKKTSQGIDIQPIDVDKPEGNRTETTCDEPGLQKRFQARLSANDPVALLAAQCIESLNDREYLEVEHLAVREKTLMRVLDGEWLDDDVLSIYLRLLIKENPCFEAVEPVLTAWGIWNMKCPETATPLSFGIGDMITSFLMPMCVNNNHWMLCVANIKQGTLEYYNSCQSSRFQELCKSAAEDVRDFLLWSGTIPNSPFANVAWKLGEGACGNQKNGDDSGVFVAAVAAAMVLKAPIPQDVEGFRLQMASQIVSAAREETLDWMDTRNILNVAQTTRDQVEDGWEKDWVERDESGKEEDNIATMECDICRYYSASTRSAAALANHKLEKHATNRRGKSRIT